MRPVRRGVVWEMQGNIHCPVCHPFERLQLGYQTEMELEDLQQEGPVCKQQYESCEELV